MFVNTPTRRSETSDPSTQETARFLKKHHTPTTSTKSTKSTRALPSQIGELDDRETVNAKSHFEKRRRYTAIHRHTSKHPPGEPKARTSCALKKRLAHPRLSHGERSRLVEHDPLELARPLQRSSSLHEDAVLRRHARAHLCAPRRDTCIRERDGGGGERREEKQREKTLAVSKGLERAGEHFLHGIGWGGVSH